MIVKTTFKGLTVTNQNIFWAMGDIPDASDWFFVPMGNGGIGSSAMSKLLSLHPEVHCCSEEDLASLYYGVHDNKILVPKELNRRIIHRNQGYMTTKVIRELTEVHRKACSHKRIFGDKNLGSSKYPDLVDNMYPNCKIILLNRNVFDALTSRNHHVEYLKNEAKHGYARLNHFLENYIIGHSYWRRYKNPQDMTEMRWGDFCDREAFEISMKRVFSTLTVDPDAVKYDDLFALCHHSKSQTDWKKDELISGYVEWLSQNDPELLASALNVSQ